MIQSGSHHSANKSSLAQTRFDAEICVKLALSDVHEADTDAELALSDFDESDSASSKIVILEHNLLRSSDRDATCRDQTSAESNPIPKESRFRFFG